MAIHSVSLRLQRVTLEYAYVSVPISPDVLTEQEDGMARLDTTRLFQQDIEMGSAPGLKWYREGVDIQLHPTQQQEPAHVFVGFEPYGWAHDVR